MMSTNQQSESQAVFNHPSERTVPPQTLSKFYVYDNMNDIANRLSTRVGDWRWKTIGDIWLKDSLALCGDGTGLVYIETPKHLQTLVFGISIHSDRLTLFGFELSTEQMWFGDKTHEEIRSISPKLDSQGIRESFENVCSYFEKRKNREVIPRSQASSIIESCLSLARGCDGRQEHLQHAAQVEEVSEHESWMVFNTVRALRSHLADTGYQITEKQALDLGSKTDFDTVYVINRADPAHVLGVSLCVKLDFTAFEEPKPERPPSVNSDWSDWSDSFHSSVVYRSDDEEALNVQDTQDQQDQEQHGKLRTNVPNWEFETGDRQLLPIAISKTDDDKHIRIVYGDIQQSRSLHIDKSESPDKDASENLITDIREVSFPSDSSVATLAFANIPEDLSSHILDGAAKFSLRNSYVRRAAGLESKYHHSFDTVTRASASPDRADPHHVLDQLNKPSVFDI